MKQIFITGASRGIGLAIAKKFHAQGFRVIICSRSEEKLSEAKKLIPGLITYQCDIGDKDAVISLAKKINTKHGKLDVLVNNGGVFEMDTLHDGPSDTYEKLIRTNLDSAYYFTRELIPPMKSSKEGTIINICSIAGLSAYGGSYTVSKFAMNGWSKQLREELKEFGIRVVTFYPGAVFTDSWAGADIPEERMMPAEDIAELAWVSYAVSDRTVVEEIVCRPQLGDM